MNEPLQELLTDHLPIQYYENGWMMYHPYFHPNHRKKYSDSDYEYLCKYYEIDGVQLMSLAIVTPPKSIVQKIHILKKNILYEYYKNLNEYWL